MKTSTTIKSPGALALGLFFAGVTARVILDDVWNGAPITLSHVNSVAALIGAIASGHLIWPCLKKAALASALGLALIFTASTGYIVVSSGARNAEAMQNKAATVLKTNEERAALKIKVAEAEADEAAAKDDYEAAKAAAAKECSSGKGKRCDGKQATRDNAARDVEKAEAFAMLQRGRLSRLGPEHEVNGGYRHAARVFAAAGLGNADEIEGRLELLLPFATVLISEIGTLTFLGMSLGCRKTDGNRQAAEKAATTRPETVGNDNDHDGCPPPKGGNRATVAAGNSRMVATKAAAEADIIRLVARGERLPSQDTLAARWKVHKGTTSKWLRDFEQRGLITRHRDGRAKRVAAA